MQLSEAVALLQQKDNPLPGTVWADLGCGNGTFTLALASLLAPGSTLHAMDKNQRDLKQIPDLYNDVKIEKWTGDFVQQLPFGNVDGILMANSLHYVKDKTAFISKAVMQMVEGRFLIVEYDTNVSNLWVPYPESFDSLKQLFNNAGFHSVQKLHERPSIYRRAQMYAAIIEK